MTTKKTSAQERAAKRVTKILNERVLDAHGTLPGEDGKVASVPVVRMTVSIGGGYAPEGILFANGKVLFCKGGRRQGVQGVVGGFNVFATDAAQVLVDLGLIKQAECDHFREWYYAASRAQQDANRVQRLREEAALVGYDIVRKPPPKKRVRQ